LPRDGAGAPLFYREPLHIVRGEGAYLFDAAGRRYVDMYNNVPCVGHAHPRIVEAMAAQQATLNVHSRYLHEGILELAERITGLHGERMESVVFSCTGTEANEVALRMARAATGRRGIVCSDAAYHGTSEAVGKLTHVHRRTPERGTEVRAFPFPQTYRPLADGPLDQLRDRYLDRLQAAIDDLTNDGVGFAGLLVCPIFANEGLPTVPDGFMPRAAEIARAAGGVVIADEVQAGYCRTGRWWGYEVAGFEPDIVVTGKPMGAGLPLAGTTASRDLVETFRGTGYFNTFASSPLQGAVGKAVIDIIEQEDLRQNVATVGAHLIEGLKEIQPHYPVMGDVRGHGLFVGVDLVEDPVTKAPDRDGAANVVNALKDRGFLTGSAGALGNVVKMRPPLVFSAADADAFLAAFREVMADRYGG
jgi:4-aminobutyrate aminotransferase-like enzyme